MTGRRGCFEEVRALKVGESVDVFPYNEPLRISLENETGVGLMMPIHLLSEVAMKRWEESIVIKSSAGDVFAYISDFMRHGDWAGHGLEVTKEGEGAIALGSKFSTVAKQFGTQREQSTITEVSAPQKFAWDSVGALGLVRHWFSLSEENGSTTVKKGAELAEPTFLAKLTGFRISKGLPQGLRSDLAKIKAHLEGIGS